MTVVVLKNLKSVGFFFWSCDKQPRRLLQEALENHTRGLGGKRKRRQVAKNISGSYIGSSWYFRIKKKEKTEGWKEPLKEEELVLGGRRWQQNVFWLCCEYHARFFFDIFPKWTCEINPGNPQAVCYILVWLSKDPKKKKPKQFLLFVGALSFLCSQAKIIKKKKKASER